MHDTGPDSDLWRFSGAEAALSVRLSGGLKVNDSNAVRLAARAGHGIAWLPEVHAFDDRCASLLVRL